MSGSPVRALLDRPRCLTGRVVRLRVGRIVVSKLLIWLEALCTLHELAACRPAGSGPSAAQALQFNPPNFIGKWVLDLVRDAVRSSGIDPRCLKFELTESLLVDEVEAKIGTMMAPKASGIAFALDDFGTGYFFTRVSEAAAARRTGDRPVIRARSANRSK